MKKLLAVLFVVFMVLTLTACASKKEEEKIAEETVIELADWQKQLGQADKISVGISPDYPPFESYDSSNNLIGFDVELFTGVIDELNKINGTNYEIEWVPMEFDTIISAIQTGQVDFGCSGFTYDPDREGSVLFSNKYLASSIVVCVKANSGIDGLDAIVGKKIAAQTGTTCADAAKEYSEDIELIKDVKVMMEAFKADAYDAVFLDEPVAKNYESEEIIILADKVEDNDTYIITNVNSEALNVAINEAIDSFMKTNAYNELVNEWGVK